MPYIKSTAVFHCPDDNGGMVQNGDGPPNGLTTAQEAGHTYADIFGTSYKFTHQNFSNPNFENDSITGYSMPEPNNPDKEYDYAGNPNVVLNPPNTFAVTSYSNGAKLPGFGICTLAAFSRPSETRIYADFPKNFQDKPIAAGKVAFHPIGTTMAYVDGHVKFTLRYSVYSSGCDGVDWAWDVPGSCNSKGIQRAKD